MKVKEVVGFWEWDNLSGLVGYYAFYTAMIEGKNAIIRRCLRKGSDVAARLPTCRLLDYIDEYVIIGDDQKGFEEKIQRIIQYVQNEEGNIYKGIEFTPIEMQYGRESDLNLANIIICEPLRDEEKDAYQYLINKKIEELSSDRLEQFKKIAQNTPEDYSVETYIKKYEKQTGTKLSESQIQGVKIFDRKIQNGLIMGRYTLKEYNNFLKSIPDLLSGKKILGVGHFGLDGDFCITSEIDEPQSAEKISGYTTYTYRRIDDLSLCPEDIFKELSSSPSIERKMTHQEKWRSADKLRVIDVTKQHQFFNPEDQKNVKGNPDMKCIGSARGYFIFSDNGILIAGEYRPTIKENSELSANDISTALQEISRNGLTTDIQEKLIGLADKKPNERSEEKL